MEVKASQIDRFMARVPDRLIAALIFGPDQGAVHERANAMARTIVPDLSDPFRVCVLEESQIASDPGRLWDEAAAISMMGGRRILRIRDAGNGLSPVMSRFLENPAGDALVIVEAGDLARTASLRQLFVECDNAAAIGCYADDAEGLESLIRTVLRAEGLSIEPDALAMLISRLGSDRGVTRSELEKLVLYAMGEKLVTEADVLAITGDESALRIDEIGDCAGLGDYAGLDRSLTRLWAAGTAPGTVLRRAMSHFQQVLVLREDAADGADMTQAIKKIRPPLHFSRRRNFLAQVSRWNSERILQALKYLYEAEALTRTTGVPEQAACSRALFSVAALAKPERR
jgi:DNA polymerase III subunit delta